MFKRDIYFCTEYGCNNQFNSRSGRNRHIRTKHRITTKIQCKHGCGKSYYEKSTSLKLHEQTCDNNIAIGGGIPTQFFIKKDKPAETGFYLRRSAHSGNYKLYRQEVHRTTLIQTSLRHYIRHDIKQFLNAVQRNIKFMVTVSFIFQKALRPGIYTIPPIYFKSSPIRTTQASNIDEILDGIYQDIWIKVEDFIMNGSGWIMYKLLNIDVEVSRILIYIYLRI